MPPRRKRGPRPDHKKLPRYAAGVIERFDGAILIARPRVHNGREALWRFPRGRVEPGESAEAAMRRFARSDVGLIVEVVVGQPPLIGEDGEEQIELRYFFCGVCGGELTAGPYAEVRWVSKGELTTFAFDSCTRPVVEWLCTAE